MHRYIFLYKTLNDLTTFKEDLLSRFNVCRMSRKGRTVVVNGNTIEIEMYQLTHYFDLDYLYTIDNDIFRDGMVLISKTIENIAVKVLEYGADFIFNDSELFFNRIKIEGENTMPPKDIKTEYEKMYMRFENGKTIEINSIKDISLTPEKSYGNYISNGLEEGVNKNCKCGCTCNHTNSLPDILEVIYCGPATIVKWADNTKTVVKHQKTIDGKKNKEPYSKEKGLAMAIAKKALGNNNKWYNTFKKFNAEE